MMESIIKVGGCKLILLGREDFERGSQSVNCIDFIRSKFWHSSQNFIINLKHRQMVLCLF